MMAWDQVMPSMRVTALAEFFFPSSRYRKVKRSSRARLPVINISSNHASNICPCVWMSTPSSSTAPAPSRFHAPHHHTCRADMHGAMCLEAEENQAPWSGSWFPARSESPVYIAEDEHHGVTPVTVPRPARTSTRNPTTGHRNNSRRAAEHLSNHDVPRFSLYANAMRQAQTCFVGTPPMAADDPNFYDQTIRFRVIDQTSNHQEVGMARREREMMVVSSPANLPSVVDTLAPPGSGRRVVIQARSPQGMVQQGDLEFLAGILPEGWPFDLVLEDE
ncbi:hypothetical protein CONLIGDRAFT_144613 [Coniochaeta ligniaria NRRL 30616]|uniref:Uncharacterized protein n=1 Tax=Coniochaeta ligniaria NRRL 30616 TaxID=1408157 RepID=A0A1J7IZ94_9PEZI|nr:hypothetical protein CONLIGDRAFT_144613 [Coniochaeta ligniaria NRRL 30616]